MLIGLVGKPSVGKSTFFKAATLAEVEIASYPFTTIKANHGVGYVKVDCIEKEFHTKCNPNKGFCINQNRFVPIDLMDVAGLVPGASEGKGLGNQFLNDLRDANAFIHIVDSSGTTDTEGKPTKDHDPCKDIIFLEDELNKWYYNILIKAWRTFARKAEMQDISFSEAIVKQFSGLKVTENQVKDVLLKAKLPEKPTNWSDEDLMTFSARLREVSKPMILAANKCDSDKSKENIEKMRKTFPNILIYPCSADSELALRQAAKAEIIEYIPGESHFKIKKELNPKQSEALNRIQEDVLNVYGGTGVQEILNKVVFDLLDYLAIFPASANKLGDSKGNILPDCFLLKNGSTALDFAYYLHTDFGKNFIKAIDAKTKQIKGKEYKLKNRDALEIITR
ncbi:MAG: GTP-binding and nucleic acid-binding protein YchF [archaeon GW2011_AR13]|nr:MAG: GTP-binding and nucleic acid-binding protein YchF [archaeon GW2011_AR13]HIG94192.1 redox-regulated ATPase YchF [Nanoarchaeota archaeon]HIH62698.1 redox-regulated ATPase YchF [Nanoarchaeota archaeon]HIJ09904.1 redox-regulated ATPase YchF [Nanoarchaeota archaeon]